MHSVIIVIHLFIAIGMVSVILLQRSEGGALGVGGGPGGLMSGRAAGNVLTRVTSGLALAFFVTSIALSVFAGLERDGGTVVDRVDPIEAGGGLEAPETPLVPLGDEAIPSAPADDALTAEPEDAGSEDAGVPIDD